MLQCRQTKQLPGVGMILEAAHLKPGFIFFFFFQMETVLGTKLAVAVYTTTAVARTVK